MRLRNRVSSLLSSRLTRSYLQSLQGGEIWSLRLELWRALPDAVRNWLGYRLFSPAEAAVERLLAADATLAMLRLPASNGYNLSPITRWVLWDLLRQKRPCRVLEFGSGVSTLIAAAYLAQQGSATGGGRIICSVEHDQAWMESTQRELRRAGLAEYVRLIHAPLEEVELDSRRRIMYSLPGAVLEDLKGEQGFDFCVVDGPPRSVGRDSCLPLAVPYLAASATILLDDSYRAGEQDAWTGWIKRYPHNLRHSRLAMTDRGLMVGEWSGTLQATARAEPGLRNPSGSPGD